MKKFFSTAGGICLFLLILSASCLAQSQTFDLDSALAWLEPAAGDWYSTKGNPAMTIQDRYINTCPILGASDLTFGYPRSGNFEVAEAGQMERNSALCWTAGGARSRVIAT